MKKTILILLLQLTYFAIFSQQYTPFPDDSAKWREYHTQLGSVGASYSYTWQEIEYFLNGDTIINNISYNKLYYSKIIGEWIPVGPYGGPPYNNIYSEVNNILKGFIREDNKKIFFLENGLITDSLLYNFDNISIGDTVFGQYPIANIDSVFIGNSFRKRYLVSAYTMDNLFLIEGIGCSSGLFPSFYEFENSDDLVCFSENNQILWVNPQPQSQYPCEYPLRIVNNELTEQLVFPNPVVDCIVISNNINRSETVAEFYNVLGKLVLSKNIYSNESKIDLSILSAGVYYLLIRGNSKVFRIIKE